MAAQRTKRTLRVDQWDSRTLNVGDVGFLKERADVETLDNYPGRTNGGGVARHTGWLGTTDNVSRSAMGCWRIVSKRPGGGVSIERLSDADADKYLAAWLRENGK